MVRPAAEIRDLGTGSGTRGPKTRGEILLVARTRCQDPCGQELTDLQPLQGFRVRQRPFEKIYFVEQGHQLLCDSMEHHFSEPKRASIGQQPAGRRSCSAPLPGGRRIEVHPDFTARPQLGFVLPWRLPLPGLLLQMPIQRAEAQAPTPEKLAASHAATHKLRT
jgi:hypothetical protein